MLTPDKSTKPGSFFFNSPRIFRGFFTISYENESIISPTSILDTKPFSALTHTFWTEKKPPNSNPNPKHSWEQPNNSKGIGIALFDSSESENHKSKQNQKRKLVVFGSQLRIQVPPTSSVFPCSSSSSSPESAGEFGIKTPNPRSNLRVCEDGVTVERENNISIIDMEKSEDYTCVISHGPNPKTTHIFDNCIVESCCGIDGYSSSYRPNGFFSLSSENFLSFCHHCKKQLQQGEDIYMYRGDKAFCSEECRCQEMLYDGLES